MVCISTKLMPLPGCKGCLPTPRSDECCFVSGRMLSSSWHVERRLVLSLMLAVTVSGTLTLCRQAGSDSNDTDGIVDGHAYTVLDCVNDVAGTQFDLVKVRNPWGSGEFKSGIWDDDGPGSRVRVLGC